MLHQSADHACFLTCREDIPAVGEQLALHCTADPAEQSPYDDARPSLPDRAWVARVHAPVGETCHVAVAFTEQDATQDACTEHNA